MRFLWAEAIDDHRTAIVIDMGGELIGGVGAIIDLDMSMAQRGSRLRMSLAMEWTQIVRSPEEFRQSQQYAAAFAARIPAAPTPKLLPGSTPHWRNSIEHKEDEND